MSGRFIDRIPQFIKLFLGLGVGVEPFPYTEAELEKIKMKMRREPFIQAILKEGITLYEAKSR